MISGAFSHVRRVRLVAGKVSAGTLSNRQWRQIEIPLEAGEAFDLVDAAISDLPGALVVDSARDSLQVRAKLSRIDPYSAADRSGAPAPRFGAKRNQILATVTPNGDDSGSVALMSR